MASSPNSSDSQDPPGDQSPGGVNFEQTLVRLEEIVHQLEDGKIGLDEALGQYEEGVGLLRKAYDMLQRAERKISLLTGVDSEGNPILRPMEDSASFSLEVGATVQQPAAAPVRTGQAKTGPRGRRTNESGMP
jgi:exodeoxyribonuclease VII small subunit